VSPLIYASVPALTTLYLFVTRNERPSGKQLLGIAVGFTGVSTIVLLPLLEKNIGVQALTGNILIVGAAISFMLYGVMSKELQFKTKASPSALIFYFSVITLIVSLPFAWRELSQFGISSHVETKHVVNAILTGIVGTGFFYLAYQYAIKLSTEVAAALFTYLQPIATIILASLFLGEKITPTFIVGGLLAVVGARVASRKK
jgi:drug/metabolite transporter (DMT)-like permease